jgi:hypothetical protein
MLTFKVDKPGEHTFTIAQFGERMVARNVEYKYSDGRMFLLRLDDSANPIKEEAIEFIDGKKDFFTRDIHLECNIQPGTYGIYAEIDWNLDSKPAK